MRSRIDHPWFGDVLVAGTEFDASENEAELLKALTWADPIEPATRGTLRLNTRDMRAARASNYETKAAE